MVFGSAVGVSSCFRSVLPMLLSGGKKSNETVLDCVPAERLTKKNAARKMRCIRKILILTGLSVATAAAGPSGSLDRTLNCRLGCVETRLIAKELFDPPPILPHDVIRAHMPAALQRIELH